MFQHLRFLQRPASLLTICTAPVFSGRLRQINAHVAAAAPRLQRLGLEQRRLEKRRQQRTEVDAGPAQRRACVHPLREQAREPRAAAILGSSAESAAKSVESFSIAQL